MRTAASDNKGWIATDRAKGAHGRVDPAGDQFLRALQQLPRNLSLAGQGVSPKLMDDRKG
jgi:hypothetical protein